MGVEVIRDLCLVVRATGEIDAANVAELESALDRAADESPGGFVLDAGAVDYLDGSGIRAILTMFHQLQSAGGSLVVVPGTIVRRLMELLGLMDVPRLIICDDLLSAEDALIELGVKQDS